ATFVALGDHLDGIHLGGVGDLLAGGIDGTARQDEERLSVDAAEGEADHFAWSGYQAEPGTVRANDLYSRVAGDVDTPFGIDGAAVASRFFLKLGEIALIG